MHVASKPVDEEAERQDGKVERRVVVVHVGHTRHDDERQVVQEPSNDGIDTRVVYLVNFGHREILESTLPAEQVPDNNQANDSHTGSGTPVNEGVAQEEVLDDVVVPSTHAQTDMEDRPLPPLRGKIVLLVRVRDKSVVGRHHGNVD